MAPVHVATKGCRRDFLKSLLIVLGYGAIHKAHALPLTLSKTTFGLSMREFYERCRDKKLNEIGLTYFALDLKKSEIQGHQMWRGKDGGAFLVNSMGDFAKFDLPIPAHSFYQHPIEKNRILAVPSFDQKALLFDLQSGNILEELTFPDLSFYGHGQILPDGDTLAFTMYPRSDLNRGLLVTASLKSKKILKTCEAKNAAFHEILFRPESSSFFIAGKTNDRASFHEVSFPDLKIKKEIVCPNRNEFRHLQVLRDGQIFLTGYGGAPKNFPYNISPIARLNLQNGDLQTVDFPEGAANKFGGEALNVIFDQAQKFAFVSNPYTGDVYKIDIATMAVKEINHHAMIKSFIRLNEIYLSMGIPKDQTRAFIYKAPQIESLNQGEIPVYPNPSGFGSHIYKVTI